jgi:hypothetical protein
MTNTTKALPGRPPNPDPEMRGVYYRKPWEVKFGKVRVGSFATREEAMAASKEWRMKNAIVLAQPGQDSTNTKNEQNT